MTSKTGRNDKCPCGSGLKYKKCCGRLNYISSEKKDLSKMESYKNFALLGEKVNALSPIIQKYSFDDLVKAIYCINICIKNRSLLENLLALNMSLIDHKNNGIYSISNYHDFKQFFSEVNTLLKMTQYDDYIIDDFGEIKLYYGQKHYEIIVGSGYELSYGYHQFIPDAANMNDHHNRFKKLLEFNAQRIGFFKDINTGNGNTDFEFTLPSNDLFERTIEYFSWFDSYSQKDEIASYFENCNDIGRVHFITKHENLFPLFNTSILIDFYCEEMKMLSDEKKLNVIDSTITKILYNLSKLQNPDRPRVIFPVAIYDEFGVASKFIYTFLLLSSDAIILAINHGRYSESQINEQIKLLGKLHSEGKLTFVEAINKRSDKPVSGLHVITETDIKLIIYDDMIDPSKQLPIYKEKQRDYIHCLAVDVIYFLSFISNLTAVPINQGFVGGSLHYTAQKPRRISG